MGCTAEYRCNTNEAQSVSVATNAQSRHTHTHTRTDGHTSAALLRNGVSDGSRGHKNTAGGICPVKVGQGRETGWAGGEREERGRREGGAVDIKWQRDTGRRRENKDVQSPRQERPEGDYYPADFKGPVLHSASHLPVLSQASSGASWLALCLQPSAEGWRQSHLRNIHIVIYMYIL